jgi:oligoendopeptidase F
MEYPMAYAETASVFGEMTTFNFLVKELREKKDDKALLALLIGKLDDMMNTVIRQIGFSNFERRIHGMDELYSAWHDPKKLSVAELNEIWLTTLRELYGKDGEVFTYENTEHLWTYIPHFHNPFYVYAYAFGELLTQSIYAKKDELAERFEPLYLEMLSSGMTLDVVGLIKPFGLDPTQKDFWINGIRVGMGALVKEAEDLAQKI